MADMHHAIQIDAAPDKVYQPIATDAGLRGWWTADSKTDANVGGKAEFGFDNRATVFRMRIEDLRPAARVVWSCLGDPDDWKGTRLTWEMSAEDGGTILRVHARQLALHGWVLCDLQLHLGRVDVPPQGLC